MTMFIDQYRSAYVVEPICKVLPIAPSTYYEPAARAREPERIPARAKRDADQRCAGTAVSLQPSRRQPPRGEWLSGMHAPVTQNGRLLHCERARARVSGRLRPEHE